MKVHVTLVRGIAGDPIARRLAYARVVAEGRLVATNPARFARHGIITGEMRGDHLERVRAVPGVEAAEVDDVGVAGQRPIAEPSRT
ncbi:MAG TPA: hypothetical protein VMT70_23360 [Vicinamibacteria bacterium]|nr:hypothetical protein [Vicinamibacteria bacterium]